MFQLIIIYKLFIPGFIYLIKYVYNILIYLINYYYTKNRNIDHKYCFTDINKYCFTNIPKF